MDVAKVVHVVSSSDKGFEDAIQRGVASAAKTLRGITGVKVTDWTAKVADDKVTGYKVAMDIAFGVEQ